MSDESTETPETDVETSQLDDFAAILTALQDLQNSIIGINSHWELERLYRVTQQGDLIDASSGDEEDENARWMSCSGAKSDRKEMLRILDFLQKKNPTDNMRLVRVETIRVVEDIDTEEGA